MIINKITTGFVIQTYDTELNKWTGQEFVAGTETDYEEAGTNRILDPAEIWPNSTEPYLPFLMQQPIITQTQSPSPGPSTAFDCFEIHGIKEFEVSGKFCEQVPDDEAAFWCLFGHIPGAALMAIGDFKTCEQAEEILARITGYTERKENFNANGTHYQ